jgi:peptidoglycan/LPS O-acetylase OafA/YrhL
MFILAALLSRHRRGIEAWVLCVAGVSQLLAVNRHLSFFYDDLYTMQSVLFCGFALSLLFAYWPPARKSASPTPALAPTSSAT